MIWDLRGDLERPYVGLGEPTSRCPTLVGQSTKGSWAPVEGQWKHNDLGQRGDFFAIAATGGLGCKREVAAVFPEWAREGVEFVDIPMVGAEAVVLINPMVVIDCLDRTRSEILTFPTSGRVRAIYDAQFHEQLVQGISCFRIPEVPHIVLATDQFRLWVESEAFTGALFVPPTKL